MSDLTIKIIDIEANTEIERVMTAEEKAQFDADAADAITRNAEKLSNEQAKEVAQAKLAALGLTIGDLKALGL